MYNGLNVGKQMKITEEQLKEYLRATNGKKSYLIEDYKKCNEKISINEFIYISDCFEKIIKMEKNK